MSGPSTGSKQIRFYSTTFHPNQGGEATLSRLLPPLLHARLDALYAEGRILALLAADSTTSDDAWVTQADRVSACLQAAEAPVSQLSEQEEVTTT